MPFAVAHKDFSSVSRALELLDELNGDDVDFAAHAVVVTVARTGLG
jgi:hypothetical protein